jgi:hypothetical protein
LLLSSSFLRGFLHLLLHSIVLCHSVRINSDAYSIEVEICALVRLKNLGVTIFTPIRSPGVLNDPKIVTISLFIPTNNLDNMLTIEFERVICSMVDAFFVGQEISEDSHLSDYWSILEDFFLDSNLICGQAIINDSVESIVDSAFISLQMILFTLSFNTSVGVARLRDESLSLSPIEDS